MKLILYTTETAADTPRMSHRGKRSADTFVLKPQGRRRSRKRPSVRRCASKAKMNVIIPQIPDIRKISLLTLEDFSINWPEYGQNIEHPKHFTV